MKRFPRKSLHFMLDPVQYREYEYGLLAQPIDKSNSILYLLSLWSGHYVFTETSGVPMGEKARLLSRTFPSTSGRCLSFWYHMYGSGMGELNVYIKPQTGAMKKVWSVSGDQGDEWKMKQVTLTSNASDYQVRCHSKSLSEQAMQTLFLDLWIPRR